MHPHILPVSRASAGTCLGPRAAVTRVTLRHSAVGATGPAYRSNQSFAFFAGNSFRTLGEPTKTVGGQRRRGLSHTSTPALTPNLAGKETLRAATQTGNMATNDPGIAIPESGPLGNAGSTTATSTSRTGREWLVIAPDRDGALQRRLEVRDQHIQNIKPLVKDGGAKLGGATMDAHPASGGETPKMNGSVLIYVADTEEQVWQLVKNDIYTKTGVWDSDKRVIITAWLTKTFFHRTRKGEDISVPLSDSGATLETPLIGGNHLGSIEYIYSWKIFRGATLPSIMHIQCRRSDRHYHTFWSFVRQL